MTASETLRQELAERTKTHEANLERIFLLQVTGQRIQRNCVDHHVFEFLDFRSNRTHKS